MSYPELYGIGFLISLAIFVTSPLETELIKKKGKVQNWKDAVIHFGFLITFACAVTIAPALLVGVIAKYLMDYPLWYSNEFGLLLCGALIAFGEIYLCTLPWWTLLKRKKKSAFISVLVRSE